MICARSAIDDIMRNFDFARVRRVMRSLDWRWAHVVDGKLVVPTEAELRHEAQRLLNLLQQEQINFIGCGGFHARRNTTDGSYELAFVVTEWLGGYDDDGE